MTGLKCKGKGDRKNKVSSERDKKLYSGLGVGLGLLAVIIVACILCIKKRKNTKKRSSGQPINRLNKHSSEQTQHAGTSKQLRYHKNDEQPNCQSDTSEEDQPQCRQKMYTVKHEKRYSTTSGQHRLLHIVTGNESVKDLPRHQRNKFTVNYQKCPSATGTGIDIS